MDKSDKNIRRLINNSSFVAWSLGEADEETAAYWDEWVSKNSANRSCAKTAQQLIISFKIQPDHIAHDLKLAAWQQLNDRTDISDNLSSASVSDLPSRQKSSGWFNSLAAAAVILILFMSAAGYWKYVNIEQSQTVARDLQTQTISTDFGEHKTIQLTDGSQIILNANSSLTYYDAWVHDQKIKVHLNGEALFAVTERQSPADPAFQVSTDDGEINVLGTRFAVSTRKEATQIVLEKGAVEISQANNSGKNIQLRPEEMALFNRAGIEIQQVNTKVYTSWTEHLFVFDQTPLKEAAKRIEHTFGVQVKIAEASMKERKLSGAVESTNLDVLTSALEKTLETSVSKEGDQIVIGKEMKSDVSQ